MLNKVKHHEFYGDIHIDISAGIAGGKRRNPRKGNMYKTIINLINLASLASTKAKKEKDNLVLGYSGIIDEIAIYRMLKYRSSDARAFIFLRADCIAHCILPENIIRVCNS
jgi:hypothetical protein